MRLSRCWFAFVLAVLVLLVGGCKSSGSQSTATGGDAGRYDIKTMTCADVMAVDAARRTKFERAELKLAADNEGVTVTDNLTNRFIVDLHQMCDSGPNDLWAYDASVAFSNALTGP
jgi:outer membrane lipoprotein-sorting protein